MRTTGPQSKEVTALNASVDRLFTANAVCVFAVCVGADWNAITAHTKKSRAEETIRS